MSNEAAGALPADNNEQAAIAAGGVQFAQPAPDGRLIVSPAALESLGKILWNNGRNPAKAAAGWRSEDPLAVACMFAAFGYPSFPCSFKAPLTKNGLYDATTSIMTLAYWSREKPASGWCVRTGRYTWGGPAGLWCFDLDGSAGYAYWHELIEKLGPPPPTWETISGSNNGGGHILYAPSDHGADMKTVTKALIAGKRGKIDQRGRGGYFVGAGSLHKSRNRYRWKEGHAPDEIPLATLPDAWVEAMDKADERAPKSASALNTRSSTRASHIHHDTNGKKLGDGPDGGGFHGPINSLAAGYFFAAGLDASDEKLIAMLRKLIEAAPKDPGRQDIGRYMSAEYLTDAIESARNYVRKKSNAK